jgi:menaquinone-dependent protoporphyrinogen oxidase
LIAYAGRHGQTRKIAAHIARRLRRELHSVELYDALIPIDPRTLEQADAIILGSAVHFGRHMPELRELATAKRSLLARKPSAFFSVSVGSNAYEDIGRFCRDTGWDPSQIGRFAGALRYTQYGMITRFVMKQMAARSGKETDTSRDYEYTDWDAVDAFASDFAQRLRHHIVAHRARVPSSESGTAFSYTQAALSLGLDGRR